jgi:hypothetical protein
MQSNKGCRFRAKKEKLESFQEFSLGRQGQDLTVTVLRVPFLLDSGYGIVEMQGYLAHEKTPTP